MVASKVRYLSNLSGDTRLGKLPESALKRPGPGGNV
jgi:hypothetical protein